MTGIGCILPPAVLSQSEPAIKSDSWNTMVKDQNGSNEAVSHKHSSGQQYLLADVSGMRRCSCLQLGTCISSLLHHINE